MTFFAASSTANCDAGVSGSGICLTQVPSVSFRGDRALAWPLVAAALERAES